MSPAGESVVQMPARVGDNFHLSYNRRVKSANLGLRNEGQERPMVITVSAMEIPGLRGHGERVLLGTLWHWQGPQREPRRGYL